MLDILTTYSLNEAGGNFSSPKLSLLLVNRKRQKPQILRDITHFSYFIMIYFKNVIQTATGGLKTECIVFQYRL